MTTKKCVRPHDGFHRVGFADAEPDVIGFKPCRGAPTPPPSSDRHRDAGGSCPCKSEADVKNATPFSAALNPESAPAVSKETV